MTTPSDSATTPLGDLLRQIAHRVAPAEHAPLLHCGEMTLPDAAPQPLPLPPELAVAWRALLGETGLPWQAEALATVRRGVGIALVAPPPLGPTTLLLLVAHHLSASPAGTLLLIAPDEALLNDLATSARNIDALLGGVLPHLVIEGNARPPRRPPPLLLLTAETLHSRVLRSHSRGWASLWPALQAVVLPALDSAPGTAIGHLRWLLRRVARLRPLARPLTVYASLSPLAEVDETLAQILDVIPPVVSANTSRVPLTWALWRGGSRPVEAAIELAVSLRSAGLSVHLHAPDPLERALLGRRGADHGLALASGASAPAHTLVVVGGVEAAMLPALAVSGYRAAILIADDSVAAQVAGQQPALLTPVSPPPLPISATNVYVSSAHLRCAAEERPLGRAEITDWEALSLVERLEKRGALAQLPGSDTWQPVGTPDRDRDAYADLHPSTASDSPVPIHDENGAILASIDPLTVERRLFPGAVVRGGRVVGWNDDGGITVRAQHGGRTMAERRTSVVVREQQVERSLDGGRADMPLRAGRVLVDHEIVARIGLTSEGDVRRVPFDPPLHTQWSAPALWLPASGAPPQAGMMLAGVLPLLLRCSADDLVPCVSDDTLYLVESQPGGRGLIDQLYGLAEALLHLAGLAARALLDDPLLGSAARADLAWMETILMPLSGLGAPLAGAEPLPSVERRTRASMVAPPSEVAARRRSRGNTFAVPRSLPRQGAVTPPEPGAAQDARPLFNRGEPAPPRPAAPQSIPAQPMRLPAQPPTPPRPPQPARPATRSEAPEPPSAARPKLHTPRPARRRATGDLRGDGKKQRSAEFTPVPKPAAATPAAPPARVESPPPRNLPAAPAVPPPVAPTPTRGSPTPLPPPVSREPTTAPARREPPPLERPPFQTRRDQDAGREPRSQDSGFRIQEPGSRNQPPGGNRESGIGNRESGNRPAASGQRPAERDSRNQPPSGSRESGIGNRESGNRPPATDSRNQPPAAGHRPPATDSRNQPPGNRESGNRPPATGHRSQDRPPATGHRPPDRPPATDHRPPNQAPGGNRGADAGWRRPEAGRDDPGGPNRPPSRPPATDNRNQPPVNRPPATDQRPPIEASSDPEALLAKARRLREQREAEVRQQAAARPGPVGRASSAPESDELVTSRFAPGDRVFCVPYGEGVVQKTRIRDGRELLLVSFPDLGDLRVDPAVNAVRVIAPADTGDADPDE